MYARTEYQNKNRREYTETYTQMKAKIAHKLVKKLRAIYQVKSYSC